METQRNPFSFYVRQTWNRHAGVNFDSKMASASTAWAGMDNTARAPYVLEAHEAAQAAAAEAPIAQAKRKQPDSRKAPSFRLPQGRTQGPARGSLWFQPRGLSCRPNHHHHHTYSCRASTKQQHLAQGTLALFPLVKAITNQNT